MPTNANTFNSRVTSEALEAKFRQVFPSQGGAELPQDLFASGVIQPVIDFSTVAEGSILPQELQQAWDFATGHTEITGATTTTLINNSGFWKVDLSLTMEYGTTKRVGRLQLTDGLSSKTIWEIGGIVAAGSVDSTTTDNSIVVFLRSGDSLTATTQNPVTIMNVWYRQIADVNGTLVNPLGFTFS